MAIMVTLDFPLQDGKQAEFLELLGGALPDTRTFDGCLEVETFAEEEGKSVLLVEQWESRKHQ
jgi:quinol monooxygenase YgiN